MKKFIYFLTLLVFAFTSCEQDEIIDFTSDQGEDFIGTTLKGKLDKATICHKGKTITVNGNALTAHLNHGDVQLIDADGDGWVTFENECMDGGDCDDNDATVYPGAEEICDNNIDDDCDGLVDEDCIPEIGDFYQGGILFYIKNVFDPGFVKGETHGYVAAPNDQGQFRWFNGSYVVTGATKTAKGTGQSNTTAIVSVQGPGEYAAQICDDLVLNGYDDWYLPSIDGLNLMYTNLHLQGLGNFNNSYYWSSTESDDDDAWFQIFGNGVQTITYKSFAWYVRPVRAF